MPLIASKISAAASPSAALCPAASTFRSMPPAKSALPEVITMPLTAASASAASTCASSSDSPVSDMTFMDLPGTSHVMVATPSVSVVQVNSAMCPVPSLTRVR